MRRLSALLLTVAVLVAGCTSGSDGPPPKPSPTAAQSVSLESLELGWTKAQGTLQPPELPATPAGFDSARFDQMAKLLTKWAALAAVDDSVWHSADPLADIRAVLPKAAGATLAKQLKDEVSPRLAVANVFGDDITVVGSPMITSAWKASTGKAPGNRAYVRLELQTRAAYEVRLGDGPSQVIGVLRVQGLSAYPDTADDFGVSSGWQEFGAGDCALALDDALEPDSDPAEGLHDLKTFIRVGGSSKLEMPPLGVEEQVDADYLKRCRDGQV